MAAHVAAALPTLPEDIAKKIVADFHAAPKPMAGAWDKDAVLVKLITKAIEKQADDEEKARDEIERLQGLLNDEKDVSYSAMGDADELRAAIRTYADSLDTETFGAGLALPADLHAVVEKLRGMVG